MLVVFIAVVGDGSLDVNFFDICWFIVSIGSRIM